MRDRPTRFLVVYQCLLCSFVTQLSEWEAECGKETQRDNRNGTATEKADGDEELAAKILKESKLAWKQQAKKKKSCWCRTDREERGENGGAVANRLMEWLSSVWLFLIGTTHNPWHQKTANHILSFHPCQVWHVSSFHSHLQLAAPTHTTHTHTARTHAGRSRHSHTHTLFTALLCSVWRVHSLPLLNSPLCCMHTTQRRHTRPRWRTRTNTHLSRGAGQCV